MKLWDQHCTGVPNDSFLDNVPGIQSVAPGKKFQLLAVCRKCQDLCSTLASGFRQTSERLEFFPKAMLCIYGTLSRHEKLVLLFKVGPTIS